MGFNCEYLLIANCEFFLCSRFANINVRVYYYYGTGSTFAIIRFVLWLELPTTQSLKYAFKTRPTVLDSI